ncbi:MAG: Rpn family recombination-promoting nuclease/putative transposase, partial [Spirochaetaceae bacterium]|nr:Rpn family recombination-promoting nuclease/putative transposase [Spirochaetaceae bacterium]
MNINNKYKDSVFTTLFNDPELLRELYCALEGVTLPANIPVSINTLENALIMGIYNDISFEIGGKLIVLLEHQSTIGPNITLRLLMYISEIYERMVKGKNIYSEKPLSIPWPEFFVLYNGQDLFPDNVVLRLSQLFEKPQDIGLPEKKYPLLELEVKVININEGRNEEIVKRCSKLHEYSAFMAKIYEYREKMNNLEEGIKEAIKYCHKHGILKEYLEKYGSEVL